MDSDEGKLFIGGIAWDTTEDTLRDYLGKYGDVTQTVIMRDKTTGRPRGFGFVVFSDPSVLDTVLQDRHTIDGRTDARKYTGMVEDCCCDYQTVDSLNEAALNPLLQDFVKTPFFRYFKVKLWCDCPFWPDDGMCRLRDCSVCECPDNEFPESFKKPSLSFDDLVCQEGKKY